MIILSMHHHALVIMIDYNNNNINNINNISCCYGYNNKSVDYFVQVWDSRIEELFCNFFLKIKKKTSRNLNCKQVSYTTP
jgi:hypothetical protein